MNKKFERVLPKAGGLAPKKTVTMCLPLEQATQEFLKDCQSAGYSKVTINLYQRTFDAFRRYPATVTGIRDFLSDLEARGNNVNSRSIYFRSLRTFFYWCEKKHLILSSPTREVKAPRVNLGVPKHLSEDEVARLYEEAGRGPFGKRNRAIVSLFLVTAIRPGELRNLRLDQVMLDGHLLRVTGKTGEREVPFTPECKMDLRAYLRVRQSPSEYFFVSQDHLRLSRDALKCMLQRLSKEAGIRNVAPYTLRHTSATLYLKQGMNWEYLQQLLGHARGSTVTFRYARATTGEVAMAQRIMSPLRIIKDEGR